MPNINRRTDWTLPLYGGIFDLPEVLLTCGRCPLPSRKSIIDFLGALVVPGYVLYQAMTGLSQHQKEPLTFWARAILGAVTQFLFMGFIGFLTDSATYWWMVDQDVVGHGLWAFAWICYISMAGFLAFGRHQIRRAYSIEGSGMEDFWSSLLLYPQALAQMVSQIASDPIARAKAVEDSAFDGL